jgi:hypothetical protein
MSWKQLTKKDIVSGATIRFTREAPTDDTTKEYVIGCVHNERFYLKGTTAAGSICEQHGNSYVIRSDELSGIDFAQNEKTKTPAKDKKRIEIEIYRKEGKTFFKFAIDPKIEELYKAGSPELRKSTSWAGLEFYYLPHLTSNKEYKDKLEYFRLFDDYGVGIYVGGKLNIAWLRTVGGKGDIQIKDPLSFAELSALTKNCVQFVKEYFEEYYREFKIRGNISVEL